MVRHAHIRRLRHSIYYLALTLILTLSLGSCTEGMPRLRLSLDGARDSVASCLYMADSSLLYIDSLPIKGLEHLELRPDTNACRSIYIDYGAGLRHFTLQDGQWLEMHDQAPEYRLVDKLPYFSLSDIDGKYHHSSQLLRDARRAILTFSSSVDLLPTQQKMDSIDSLYRGEKLTYIHTILHPSDSLCRRLSKEAKLKGIIVSDTLGYVSSLRTQFGLDRIADTYYISVDSLEHITQIP